MLTCTIGAWQRRSSTWSEASGPGGSRGEQGVEAEPGAPGRAQRVDRGDAAVVDGEGEHRDRYSRLGGDEAGRAVDDGGVCHARGAVEARAGRDRVSALENLQCAVAIVGAK